MIPYFSDVSATLYHGDALEVARELPSGAADCIVTSPPYFSLRDYGVEGQYGLEATPAEYVETMRRLFSELRRVLADDGTCWLNLGDSYSAGGQGGNLGGGAHLDLVPKPTRTIGVPPKNLLGIPWQVAFALQADGWILRNAIVWEKVNAMPESVQDRLSQRYEMVFMFAKRSKYWFGLDSIRSEHSEKSVYQQEVARRRPHAAGKAGAQIVPGSSAQGGFAAGARELNPAGRNPGDVWEIPTIPFAGSHFAVMPAKLAERCVQAGCPPRRCGTCGAVPTRTHGDFVPDMSRAQTRRAYELAEAADLTPAHYAAVRAGGLSRSGKVEGQHTQQNNPEVSRLAAEVRTALGGNYSELLRGRVEPIGWTDCGHSDYRPGIVLDPFSGSGTTGLAAAKHGRRYIGIDLNSEYLDLSLRTRLHQPGLDFEAVTE